jgi:hypothetical protein
LPLRKAAASECAEEFGFVGRATGIERDERICIAKTDARFGSAGGSLRIGRSGRE